MPRGRPRLSPSKRRTGRHLKCPCCMSIFYYDPDHCPERTRPSKDEVKEFKTKSKATENQDRESDTSVGHSEGGSDSQDAHN
jgi:hypothetical protein